MKSNDIKNKEEIRVLMQNAIKGNDTEAFYAAFDQMLGCIENDIKQSYEDQIENVKAELDTSILSARGVRQLTNKEHEYYQKLSNAMRSKDPKQALNNLDVVMPETVIDSVFEELKTNHPLLSKIQFIPSSAKIKMLMNTNGHQEAVWGELTDEIVKELVSGFKEVDSGLLKLSAFLPICKSMLDLGPQWLDSYVRQVLYEALANGLEAGIVTGDGNGKPIGMNRQVGDGVTVTGGVFPTKPEIKVSDFSSETVGNLISLMAMDQNGKSRDVRDLILVVNPQDYFGKVMPATTIMAPDGTYRNNVLPYPMTIVQSAAVENGKAILGMGHRYFAAAGTSKGGEIEFSDHYRFLEDQRVYLIKAYANGMPMDNNAFLYLDISNLAPKAYRVESITPPTPSGDATLSELRLGSLTLSPEFKPDTTSYTASTSNASNTINAITSDAGATVAISLNDEVVSNGSALTWESGSNTVEITVTAADGTTASYIVTVTKS